MGLYIRDQNAAVAAIRAITVNLTSDVRIELHSNPFSVQIDFLDSQTHRRMAGFTLVQQTNCCGILVSTQTYVEKEYRGQHMAQDMMPLKAAIARHFGYSMMMATVNISGNPAEAHILEKDGWRQVQEFVNSRTTNRVGVFTKAL